MDIDELKKEMPHISLEAEFDKLLEDTSFKKIVNSLNFDKSELMKYTSSFEKTISELKNCKKCAGLAACKNEIIGFIYYPETLLSTLNFGYVACKYKKEELEKTKFQKNVYLFEIPKELKAAKMSEIFPDKTRLKVIQYIQEFIDQYDNEKKSKGLYLHGSFGGGKTYLIAAMFNELAKRDIASAIIYFPEYLRDLKASFDDDYADKVSFIKRVPLLLIDDIGAENVTSWGRDEILGSILQYRMQENLPTFFTSNLTIIELEDHLAVSSGKVDKLKARRIIERIKQLTNGIEMISPNKRK